MTPATPAEMQFYGEISEAALAAHRAEAAGFLTIDQLEIIAMAIEALRTQIVEMKKAAEPPAPLALVPTRSVDEHGHVSIALARGGGAAEYEIVLELGTGGTSFRRFHRTGKVSVGYFYPDEDTAIVKAWAALIAERPVNRQANAEAWLAVNGDLHMHLGHPVDLSINETRAFLANAQTRIGKMRGHQNFDQVQVAYQGEWLGLCRTDLKDDVCTGGASNVTDAAAEVERYITKIRYGARIRDFSFAVIDSYSDG